MTRFISSPNAICACKLRFIKASSWVASNKLNRSLTWFAPERFEGFLEGNAVVGSDNNMYDVIRTTNYIPIKQVK
jgi:hypothetical protein